MTAADYHARLLALPYKGPRDKVWASSALAIYCEMLKERVHFAQAAYRDGEFPWICGVERENANGERYEPDLGRQLAETLKHPVGQWFVYFAKHNPFRPKADAWLREHAPGLRWIPDRPFGRASEMGLLKPFWEAIRDRKTCVFGPAHLARLPANLTPHDWAHVPVPEGVAWKHWRDIASNVFGATDAAFDLILIAAGSAAGLVIADVWADLQAGWSNEATLIDIGATLDPYAGVFSRNRTRVEAWQRDVLPLNLP